MKTMLIAIAGAGALLAGTPGLAKTTSVEHLDLNLSTPEGQKVLEQRIDRAARAVCGLDDSVTGTRIRSSEAKRCYTAAKAQAKESVAARLAEKQLGG